MSLLARARHSLITRLMLYFIITVLLTLAVFAINFVYGIRVHFKQEILPNVAQYMEYIIQDIGTPPDLDKARRLSDGLFFELVIQGPELNWQSHDAIPDLERLDFEPAPKPYQGYRVAHARGNNFVLLQRGEYRYVYVVGRLFKREHRRGFLIPVLMVGVLGLLFWLIRSSLKPLNPVNDAVREIGAGNLEPALVPAGSTEFRQLADGINDMARQIRQMLAAKHELLLAISHELRSPLTRARVNLELIADESIRDTLVADIREMQALIEMILESERLNQRHAALDLRRFDFAAMVEQVVERFFHTQSLDVQLVPVEIVADRARLELLLKNLLDNAIKYSPASAAAPVVRVLETQQQVVLEVEDSGIGMNQDQAKQATQAFYRADPARQRSTGGYGLGLYLCQQIVRAHRGALTITSTPGQGTRVTVCLAKNAAEITQQITRE